MQPTMTSGDIILTERAARRIREIVGAEPGKSALRVAVAGGGCSGFQYEFGLEAAVSGDDHVFERDGATVVVDPTSLPYLLGSRIDFVDDLIGAQFRIDNPNATASCGCGTSFSI
jgi:iron-sulfur cluster assembly accessory protein